MTIGRELHLWHLLNINYEVSFLRYKYQVEGLIGRLPLLKGVRGIFYTEGERFFYFLIYSLELNLRGL